MRYYLDLVKSVHGGNIPLVYLFHGEEVFLHARAVEMLRGAILAPEAEAFDGDILDGEEVEPALIVRAAETSPVLGARRLVVVRRAPGLGEQAERDGGRKGGAARRGAGGVQALERYLEDPCPSTCLVLIRSGAVDRRRRLCRLIEKKGCVVDFTLLSEADRLRWAAKRVREAGKTATPTALRRLVTSSTGGLTGLEQDLNKVLCYMGDDPAVTEETVAALVTATVEENIFAVIDAVGTRRARRALEGLAQLLRAGEPPLRLLSMLARQFAIILAVGDLGRGGLRANAIAQELGLRTFVVRRALEQAGVIPPDQAALALAGARDIDIAVKTGQREFYPAVADLVLRICSGRQGR